MEIYLNQGLDFVTLAIFKKTIGHVWLVIIRTKPNVIRSQLPSLKKPLVWRPIFFPNIHTNIVYKHLGYVNQIFPKYGLTLNVHY